MLYFSKRSNENGNSSNSETCLSIIGLFLAIGFIGGLAGLIYGLVKGSSSGTIVGAIVFGISVFLIVIFILVVVFCLKNDDVQSDPNQQQPPHHHHRKEKRRRQNEQSPQEITTISTVQRYDQGTDLSLQISSRGLSDSTNQSVGKQSTQSPSKTSSFTFTYPNDPLSSSSNFRQNNYNRH